MCSWLEDLNRRHAEIVASRISADKMRQRDQVLSAENEKLKVLINHPDSNNFDLKDPQFQTSSVQWVPELVQSSDFAFWLHFSDIVFDTVGEYRICSKNNRIGKGHQEAFWSTEPSATDSSSRQN